MKIKNKKIIIPVLMPDNPDNWLTDGKNFLKQIYLGADADPGDWREIANEEYKFALERRIREAEGF